MSKDIDQMDFLGMAVAEKPAEMSHALLVELAARWLEKTRGCSLVLTEFACASYETPDAIGWRISEGWSVMIECKTSRGDFFRDLKKPARQHARMRVGQERWYLTPPELLKPEEIPEGWGLLEAGAKIKVALRCPAGPEVGKRYGRGTINEGVQANELQFLLSVYRRKLCKKCARDMYRGASDEVQSTEEVTPSTENSQTSFPARPLLVPPCRERAGW